MKATSSATTVEAVYQHLRRQVDTFLPLDQLELAKDEAGRADIDELLEAFRNDATGRPRA